MLGLRVLDRIACSGLRIYNVYTFFRPVFAASHRVREDPSLSLRRKAKKLTFEDRQDCPAPLWDALNRLESSGSSPL